MINRPRPRVEGKPNARFGDRPIKAGVPDSARVVPKRLASVTNPRATAAKRMLGGTPDEKGL